MDYQCFRTFSDQRLMPAAAALLILLAAARAGENYLGVNGRYHTDHSVFTDLPYDNGNLSYGLAYEYAEKAAIWQLGMDFASHVTGARDPDNGATNAVGTDYVLTPQFNLIIRDKIFRGGAGILASYLRDDDGGDDWIAPYWQLQLGLSFPVFQRFSLDISTYYVYERWDKLPDFKPQDLEYGAWVKYKF